MSNGRFPRFSSDLREDFPAFFNWVELWFFHTHTQHIFEIYSKEQIIFHDCSSNSSPRSSSNPFLLYCIENISGKFIQNPVNIVCKHLFSFWRNVFLSQRRIGFYSNEEICFFSKWFSLIHMIYTITIYKHFIYKFFIFFGNAEVFFLNLRLRNCLSFINFSIYFHSFRLFCFFFSKLPIFPTK